MKQAIPPHMSMNDFMAIHTVRKLIREEKFSTLTAHTERCSDNVKAMLVKEIFDALRSAAKVRINGVADIA